MPQLSATSLAPRHKVETGRNSMHSRPNSIGTKAHQQFEDFFYKYVPIRSVHIRRFKVFPAPRLQAPSLHHLKDSTILYRWTLKSRIISRKVIALFSSVSHPHHTHGRHSCKRKVQIMRKTVPRPSHHQQLIFSYLCKKRLFLATILSTGFRLYGDLG